jgi:2-polyprenyl-3-methyl-5-hydroxy-6-metoxy-1,4-benzoquinol methylase
MSVAEASPDKAGKAYWDALWRDAPPPVPIDARAPGLANTINRRFHEVFLEAFGGRDVRGQALLEIGCARSPWLPYFAQEFGFRVSGLDYSEIGCRQEEDVLRRAGVEGRVICADLFDPPADLRGSFDAVVSFGLVEHFDRTAEAVAACADFLRPGGVIVTSTPNLKGLLGALQRRIDRAIYDIHVPLDAAGLARAHEAAGLRVRSARMLLPLNLGVLNMSARRPALAWKFVAKAAELATKAVWAVDRLRPLPETPYFAPYAVCVAEKLS